MLVLSRKLGERIRIGDTIVLTIVRIDDRGVRIGLEAPPDVKILREELKAGRVDDRPRSPAPRRAARRAGGVPSGQ